MSNGVWVYVLFESMWRIGDLRWVENVSVRFWLFVLISLQAWMLEVEVEDVGSIIDYLGGSLALLVPLRWDKHIPSNKK